MIAAAILAATAVLTARDAVAIEGRVGAMAREERWNEVREVADEVADAPPEVRSRVLRRIARELCAGPGCASATGILQDAIALGGDDPEIEMLRAFDAAERGSVQEALARLDRMLADPGSRDLDDVAIAVVGRAFLSNDTRWPEDVPPFDGWTISRPPAPSGRDAAPEALAAAREAGWELPRLRWGKKPEYATLEQPTAGTGPSRVILDCAILRSGHVVPVRVLSSPGRGFTETTRRALTSWRYTPAKHRGVVVPIRYTVLLRIQQN